LQKTVKEVSARSKTSTKQVAKVPQILLLKPLPFIAKIINNETAEMSISAVLYL
jgi:hypothetical protein